MEWTNSIIDKILKKVEMGKVITTALKSIVKLVKLQSLVAKRCKFLYYKRKFVTNLVSNFRL